MDRNFQLGNILLPFVLQLLKQLPAPTAEHCVNVISAAKTSNNLNGQAASNEPTFTLYLLDPRVLRCWLQTLFVISYKVRILSLDLIINDHLFLIRFFISSINLTHQ